MAEAVLITGASTGIGRACALDLAARGYRVFAGVRRHTDGEALRSASDGRVTPVELDVVDEAQVTESVAALERELAGEGLTGLVNNAGIVVAGPLEFLESEDLRRQLEVNVVGQLTVTRACLPLLRRANGRIVFVGSSSGYLSTPFTGAYCASKYAIEAVGDALRRELLPWKLSVSIVQPGAIQTPIWEKSKSAADEIIEKLPERAHELYGGAIEKVQGLVEERSGSAAPVEKVAKAVHHALSARRPKTRYRVGLDATGQAWLARLPDRWVDFLLNKVFGTL